MSRRFHPNPFDLLGQTEMYVYPVHLSGFLEPKLDIAWDSFHNNFFSGIPVFFQRAKIAKDVPPSTIFPDLNLESRVPVFTIFLAAVLHIAFFLAPWPEFAVTPPPNHVFDNTQLTWSGPINDLPLLQIPKNRSKSSPKSEEAKLDSSESAEAFHPRQRIYTDPVRPTHPRQTLINTSAPAEAPKILPPLPNVVQLAASQAPAKPRMEIDEKALAKLHPKTVKSVVAKTETPTPDIANLEQHTALLNIASSANGPAKPKLEINPSSAPHVGHQSQLGDVSDAPPPEVPIGGAPNSNAASTLIALSANPAPPVPTTPPAQGNLAARVAMSPEGKPGASGTSTNATSGSGAGGLDPMSSGKGGSNSSVGISITGGNPKPSPKSSGLGGPLILALPKSESGYKRPDPNAVAEDPPERVGPPDFAVLAPGAKPEQIFSTKHVYTMNVNMPNLNSATGSWIIHFSELHIDPAHRGGSVSSPVPVHKVDPKYPQASVMQHIEGEVILYAVIRKDGSVDGIQKVRGLDDLLDANSIDAFAKWKFEPALRDSEPVDVEAIVHIPFKAAPRQ